jgi:hypothetical protein
MIGSGDLTSTSELESQKVWDPSICDIQKKG